MALAEICTTVLRRMIMAVKYLVDLVKQPNKVSCWAAALLMLKRYALRRTGLGMDIAGPLESMIGMSSTKDSRVSAQPMHWQHLTSWCNRLGLRWRYVDWDAVGIERALAIYGPLVYIARLPDSGWQHALVLTGAYPQSKDYYRIMFNDPDGGRRRELPVLDFIRRYPPFFQRNHESQAAVIYAPRNYVR
jgi:hypothetical protein